MSSYWSEPRGEPDETLIGTAGDFARLLADCLPDGVDSPTSDARGACFDSLRL